MTAPAPCVVVTRPQPVASLWVQALRAAGTDAVALPLLRTEPISDAQEFTRWTPLADACGAAMWVSPVAVSSFFDSCLLNVGQGCYGFSLGDLFQPACRHWVTGPGTAKALVACGVAASSIDAPPQDAAQLDSEHLWPVVAPQLAALRAHQRAVLIVRGADASGRISGRDWLAQQLAADAVLVEQLASYRRLAAWDEAQAQNLREREAQGQPLLWVFSSSEAVRSAQAHWPPEAHPGSQALATHPRIAEAAHACGWTGVQTVQPLIDDVVAAVRAWHPGTHAAT